MDAWQIYIPEPWVEHSATAYDIAVIRIDSLPSVLEGSFLMPFTTTDSLHGDHVLNLAGYPTDRIPKRLWHSHGVQVVDPAFAHRNNTLMFHDLDTWGGNSGSPVYTYNPMSTPHRILRAIHVARAESGTREHNIGVLINREKVNLICTWLHPYKCSQHH